MMVLNKYLTGWSLCSYETGCFGSTMGHKDHTVRKHNVREVGVVVIHHQSFHIVHILDQEDRWFNRSPSFEAFKT